MTNHSGDKARAAWARWVGKPSGLTPELASRFMLGFHGGKTIKDMTFAGGDDYICSTDRLNYHLDRNPEWAKEARALSLKNSNTKKSTNAWLAKRTHCPKGHEFAIWGRMRKQTRGWTRRRCILCEKAYVPGKGTIKPDAAEKVRAALQSGEKIATIIKTIIRPPVFKLLRSLDPSIDVLIKATKPLRSISVINAPIVMARQSNEVYQTISDAVSYRMARDIRREIISLVSMDYYEGRITIDQIGPAVRKYSSRLHADQKFTVSLDQSFEGGESWLDNMPASAGLWAESVDDREGVYEDCD